MKNIICPYCSNELIHGYIKTNGEIITWSPSPKKKSLFTNRWHVDENETVLAKFNLFKGAKVDAFKCVSCNKVIISIEAQV